MVECDKCGKEIYGETIYELGTPRPPYYDVMRLCAKCYKESEDEKWQRLNREQKKNEKS